MAGDRGYDVCLWRESAPWLFELVTLISRMVHRNCTMDKENFFNKLIYIRKHNISVQSIIGATDRRRLMAGRVAVFMGAGV